jgi:DNA replication and repair protein RecF
VRGTPPVMLLDDAMSELDSGRRERLVARLRGEAGDHAGQSVITTTDLAAVPGADAAGTARLAVAEGVVLAEAEADAA